MSRYDQQLFEYFNALDRKITYQPLILGAIGGSGGGIGGRPGGYIGQLSQIRVTYDLSEDATLFTPASGASLLDNLNHIRYRIETLESGFSASSLNVYDEDTLVKSGVTILNFLGDNINVTDGGTNQVDITISGVQQTIFTSEGSLITVSGQLRIYNLYGINKIISKVFLSVGTPPSTQSIIVDINKNGTTIFTTQANRPAITSGQYTGFSTNIDVPTWGSEEYLTMDIDQVGIGSDLTVHIVH